MKRQLYQKYQIEIDRNTQYVRTEEFVQVVNKLLREIDNLKKDGKG
jgi:hypothetical protein